MVIFVGIIALAIMLAIRGLAVMLLWNSIITQVFNTGSISFLDSVGLIVLIALLVGPVLDKSAFPEKDSVSKDLTPTK